MPSHPISLSAILTFPPTHLRLGLQLDFFIPGFYSLNLCLVVFPLTCTTYHTHHILLDYVTVMVISK
jgi:hypothetical protein